MKRYFLRIAAFMIDTFIVVLLSVAICNVKFINPKLDEMLDYQELADQEVEVRDDLKKRSENIIKDDKINEMEYDEIKKDFPDYYDIFKDVVVDEKLSDDFKKNLNTEIEKKAVERINDYNYEINKRSLVNVIVSIVLYLLYFGVWPFLMGGQTLAKKILRLKVVDSKDESRRIPLWKYLIRAFLICELVFTVINAILLYTVSKSAYINAAFWISEIRYLYEVAFLVCLVIREDQRSIHDLLLGTEVILIDKNGERVIDAIQPETEEVKHEEAKEVKTTKKSVKSPKKATAKKSKAKEEVKAEKVDD